MNPINLQTTGPIATDAAESGGVRLFSTVNGANVAFTDDLNDRDLKGQYEDAANGRLLAAAYSAFDKAGRELGIDATELAGKLDLVALIHAAREVVGELDHDTLGAGTSARVLKLESLLARLKP